MDVGLILRIGGIGLIVMVLNIFLSKNGREDLANLVALAGVIIAILLLVTKLGELLDIISGVFGVG